MCLGLTLYLAGPGKYSTGGWGWGGTGLAAAGEETAIRITFISSSTRRQGKIRSQRERKHSPGHRGNPQKAWDGAVLLGPGAGGGEKGGASQWDQEEEEKNGKCGTGVRRKAVGRPVLGSNYSPAVKNKDDQYPRCQD